MRVFYKEEKLNHIIYSFLGIKISIKTTKKQEKLYRESLLKISEKPSNLPKASGYLRNNQLQCAKLLSDIKNICNANNLKYWLDFGTLLGAIRHQGFIPYDSDIDICMLRNDYLKIIPLLKEFYKNTNIIIREYGDSNNFQIRIFPENLSEFGVDIFPMDEYYKSSITQNEVKTISNRIRKAIKILKIRIKKEPQLRENITKVREIIKKVQEEIILKKHNSDNNSALFYGIDFEFPYKNLIKNYDLIFPLKTIIFEEEIYSCPNKVEENLIYHYGKRYMDYPKKFKYMEDKLKEYISSIEIINEEKNNV